MTSLEFVEARVLRQGTCVFSPDLPCAANCYTQSHLFREKGVLERGVHLEVQRVWASIQ